MAFGNLTVDFRQLARVPVRDRAALARSAQASEIFGNLTPSQIAALFPDYYKKFIPQSGGGGSMAAGLTGAGTTSTGTSTSTATSTTATAPTTRPGYPGFIEEILAGNTPAATTGAVGTSRLSPGSRGNLGYAQTLKLNPRKKALLDAIATDSGGGYGTINYLGAKFIGNETADFSQHPFQDPSKRGLTKYRASGRYQITLTNYEKFAKQLGLHDHKTGKSDFSPEAQDLIAFEMAKDVYRVGSDGRNLEEDINNPNISPEQLIKPLSIDYGWHILKKQSGMNTAINVFKNNLPTYQQELLETQTAQPLPGTAPITGQTPQGSDAQIQNLLGTPADQSTAVVAAPRGPAKTMILSLGTNDFSDPKNTYQNTLDAINEGRRKGYNVVVVPPTGSNDRFKSAYDEVMRAVNETGAPVEQPQSYSSDGYHPTADEYKRIGEKYQGAVVVGDSIAVGIGQHVDNGKTVATEGIRTDTILSRLRSEEIAKLETTQVTTSSNFDPAVFAQIDPRVKEWYDKANDSEKRLLEAAITQKGLESINQTMQKYPKATATAAGATILEEMGEINNVEYGTLGNRNNPVDTALQRKISAMVSDIYGPEYKAVIYSGGEPTSGQKVSDSGRHDVKFDAEGKMIGGQAADLYITHRETGEVVPRAQQIKAAQYWQARQFGGVGLGMKGGGIHLDQIQRGEATGENLSYRAWAYGEGDASQRFLTKEERSAMIQARSEDFDISSITIPKQQTAQTLPGTEAQTQSVRPDDTAQIPLQQSTANTAPAMKLGGEMNFKEPNTVKESMSLVANGKEVAQFNKNEQVNVEDGKIKVQNEYDKRTKEAQQRNDKGTPTNQYSMRQTTTPETPRTFPDQVKYGIVPQSPSAKRQFETAQFGGYDHFSRRSHSS